MNLLKQYPNYSIAVGLVDIMKRYDVYTIKLRLFNNYIIRTIYEGKEKPKFRYLPIINLLAVPLLIQIILLTLSICLGIGIITVSQLISIVGYFFLLDFKECGYVWNEVKRLFKW